jgi:UDP-N-acetylmuramate dehydrogenase
VSKEKSKREAYKEISKIKGLKVLRGVRLRHHSTFRIGGAADLFVIPKNVSDLIDVLTVARRKRMKVFVAGNGSNVLFSEKGYRGIVIKLANDLSSMKVSGERVVVWGGASLSGLIMKLATKGLGGLEFACGVPATVGGSVMMNLGAFGKWMGKYVKSVELVDEKLKKISMRSGEIKFGYRTSSLLRRGFILTCVELKLRRNKPRSIKAKIKKVLSKRRIAQPLGIPNAGCVFKNPRSRYAGQLIEEAGLKGKRVGDAQISTKHANFIVNLGSATSSDVIALIRKVQQSVKSKFGVRLVPEVKIVRP